ncbi:MAG: c-type cytochrome [Candidatus Omnitrophica bacterium]|nr:c-type cytochrome [Candidatus Omnitrophota bacterium]
MKRLLFLLSTAALAGLFVLAMWQDLSREWAGYQRQFFRSLAKDERRGLSGGIKQLIVSELHRVDRCTTCHLAIDKPQLALAEEPFTAHPGDYLAWHPPEKFGCTVCHDGQGLATEVQAAHGDVKHWERPLLRGRLVQASCLKCHGDLERIRDHVPALRQGIALYKQHGCAGCHAVHGVGQTVSIDLSDMGDKPWQLLDFTFVEGHHNFSQWVYEHFKEPRRVTPGFRAHELPPGEEEIYPTFMPHYGLSDDEAWALTVYMLGLTGESLPAKYVLPSPPAAPQPTYASSIEAGRAVFERLGCVACHGTEGRGGRRNLNAVLWQEAPPLVLVKAYYEQDREGLKELIRAGRQPVPRLDPSRPVPPLYMPAWKERLTEEELDHLVDYLFSLADAWPAAPQPVSAAADDTEGVRPLKNDGLN